jgi:archaemetzincin
VHFVNLQPIGSVDDATIDGIGRAIEETFGLGVTRAETADHPDFAFDAARQQYSSELILRRIVGQSTDGAFKILGITNVDLFIPMLSFVYGQAQLNGRVAVVSIARLHQEFYGMHANRALTVERAAKESLHELGHTFGLTHCSEQSCLMSIATGIVQLDAKGDNLCHDCSLMLDQALSIVSHM